jgi:hypothetical protein
VRDCLVCGGEIGTSYTSCDAVENVILVDVITAATLVKGLLSLFENRLIVVPFNDNGTKPFYVKINLGGIIQ